MKKSILLLMSIQFFVYLGFGLIIPILPEVIIQSDFHDIHVAGLLTVYSIASFFTAPLWGSYSDRVGRKPLIMIGLFGFSLSFFVFSLFIDNLLLMYISRIIGGIFSGALYTAVNGYVADMTSEENRNKYMGLIGMSLGLGFLFGPALGGLLGHIDLRLPFSTSAMITFLLLLYAYIVLREPERRQEGKKRVIMPKGSKELWQYRIRFLFLLSFMVTFLLAGVEATFQLFQFDKIQITPLQVGILFMASGLVDAAIQGGVVRRVKDGAEWKWILVSLAITAIGLFLFPFTNSLLWAGLALCVFTAGNALARTILVSLTTKESGGKFGTAAGVSYSMDNIGRIIGPLLFTWILTHLSGATYFISAALSVLSILLIIMFYQSKKTLREYEEPAPK